jgi:hypothetical protein
MIQFLNSLVISGHKFDLFVFLDELFKYEVVMYFYMFSFGMENKIFGNLNTFLNYLHISLWCRLVHGLRVLTLRSLIKNEGEKEFLNSG